MDKKQKPRHLGIFVAGYRWSGSGAVSDWLAGHDDLCRVEGSEAAFGEIRAINYGLRFLVQTAAGRIHYGERLGRWALCPDPTLWNKILGSPLTRERGSLSVLYTLVDALYYSVARLNVIPSVTKYKDLLDAQLGRDFRTDREYLDTVTELTKVLRKYMQRKNKQREEEISFAGPEGDEEVRYTASQLLSLIYQRLSTNNRVLIFDNAISGLYPELFNLLDPSIFSGQVIIFVRRDPRDQFVELVKYSGSTFPWSVGKFIDQYRKTQEKTKKFIESISSLSKFSDKEGCTIFIRQISFEAFVLNKDNIRTSLKDDLQQFWEPFGIEKISNWNTASPETALEDGMNGLFNPEKSKLNIGIWRTSGLKSQINRIANELSEYI